MTDERRVVTILFADVTGSTARPSFARSRCEIALLARDRDELEAGLADLESIGDEVQVERYLKAWSAG